jgi:hypothetical protein
LNELKQCFLIPKAKVEKSFALKNWGRKEAQRVYLDDIRLAHMITMAMLTL